MARKRAAVSACPFLPERHCTQSPRGLRGASAEPSVEQEGRQRRVSDDGKAATQNCPSSREDHGDEGVIQRKGIRRAGHQARSLVTSLTNFSCGTFQPMPGTIPLIH
jgi:hypothetical protein